MAATNHDIFSHAERIGRIVDIQRLLDDSKRVATSAQRKFDSRMRLADHYVTWEELWDALYLELDTARSLAAQAKIQLDLLLGSVTESATYYPGFLFQAKWTVGLGGVAKIVLTDGGGSSDTIHLLHEDTTTMTDAFACAGNTHTDTTTMLDTDDKIAVVGTATQDGVYTVASCSDSTITLATGTLPAATESCAIDGAYILLLRRNLGV